jgi:hypothetical protein
MMHAAMRIDQLDPPAAEAFEGFDLRRIDDVLNHAGDHPPTRAALAPPQSPRPQRHERRGAACPLGVGDGQRTGQRWWPAAGAGGRGRGSGGHARSYLERGRWAVQGAGRRPSIRMFSRRLGLGLGVGLGMGDFARSGHREQRAVPGRDPVPEQLHPPSQRRGRVARGRRR